MKQKIYILIAGVILGIAIPAVFYRNQEAEYESKAEAFEKRKAIADLVLVHQDSVIHSLRLERDTLLTTQDSLVLEVDSAFITLEKLTKIDVTEDDQNEALLWIHQHNASLEE